MYILTSVKACATLPITAFSLILTGILKSSSIPLLTTPDCDSANVATHVYPADFNSSSVSKYLPF